MSLKETAYRRLSAVLTLAAVPLSLLMLLVPASASAEVQYGTLSNFDTFNDTGEETHGFEIELDGISSADISYEFGAPYERYGNPKLVDFPGGVYVRYESPYDSVKKEFTQGTPVAPSPITPTLGHQCWTGALGANYFTAGCEHFGLGLIKNPTKTAYHWLVADPSKPGNLINSSTKVSLPAPVWNVLPPAGGNPAPVVQAVIQAPEPAPAQLWGEAVWVKIYETESPEKVALNHLLTDDPVVPQEKAEVETEWVLMQSAKGAVNVGAELAKEKPLGKEDQSVTRRYEIYKYTGPFDEEGEATPLNEANPEEHGEVGEYIGAQMAAVNIEAGEPAPTVSRLSVKTGPATGGTTVTISGTGFTGATAVRFGSTDAKSFKVNPPAKIGAQPTITAESPAGTAGTVDVRVTTPNGANAPGLTDHFVYGPPTITGLAPNTGPKTGGTSVTVTGTGFAPGAAGTTLKFGGKLGTSVECLSTTTCTVLAPAVLKAVTVEVHATVAKKVSGKVPADLYKYS